MDSTAVGLTLGVILTLSKATSAKLSVLTKSVDAMRQSLRLVERRLEALEGNLATLAASEPADRPEEDPDDAEDS